MKTNFVFLLILLAGCQAEPESTRWTYTSENPPFRSLRDASDKKAVDKAPEEWRKGINYDDDFEVRIDTLVHRTGEGSGYIRSFGQFPEGFGNISQSCSAENFLGQRIKMTGYIKSDNVREWAGMWLRVDPKVGFGSLQFDNMKDRPIKKTVDWTKCEIVLDVPEDAGSLNYGFLLVGKGKIWVDDISFEIVDENTPLTSPEPVENKIPDLKTPKNTEFEPIN